MLFQNEFFDVDDNGAVFDKNEACWGHVVKSRSTGRYVWSDGSDSEWYEGLELIRVGLLLAQLDAEFGDGVVPL